MSNLSYLNPGGVQARKATAMQINMGAARGLQEIPEARHRMEKAERAFQTLKNGMWWGICLHRLAVATDIAAELRHHTRDALRPLELLTII